MSRWMAIGLVLLFAIGAIASACGGGGDGGEATKQPARESATAPPGPDETPEATAGTPSNSAGAAAIEALVRAQTDASNNKDVDGFVAAFADSYYDDLGVSRDDARALVATFIGVPQVDVTKISAIDISRNTATALVDSDEGVIVSREQYSFARVGDRWLIAGIEELPVDVPAEAAVVEMRLDEYAFEFDSQAASDGDFVFNVTNTGAQPHEVELMRLPAGVTAQQLSDRENVPAGVETIGLFGPLEPLELRPIVFAQPLEPGNYALVCYLSTPDGVSNAALGMVKDLVVP